MAGRAEPRGIKASDLFLWQGGAADGLALRLGQSRGWWILPSVRTVLLGCADPGSPLHMLRHIPGLCSQILKRAVAPRLLELRESSRRPGLPHRRTEEVQARLLLIDRVCFLVSKNAEKESAMTPGALDSARLQWDVLRGEFCEAEGVAICAWQLHARRVLSRESHFTQAAAYETSEALTDTGWESMGEQASLRWQRLPVAGEAGWVPVELDCRFGDLVLGPLAATGDGIGEVYADSSDSDSDDDYYEHFLDTWRSEWYPTWDLLGIDMHGLYTFLEFAEGFTFEYNCGFTDFGELNRKAKMALPLPVTNLNQLFGFSEELPARLTQLDHELLWAPISDSWPGFKFLRHRAEELNRERCSWLRCREFRAAMRKEESE